MDGHTWTGVVAGAVSALALLAACSQDTADGDPDASSSVAPGEPDSASTAATDAPESGTCWTAPGRAFAFDFYFDDLSTQVPCSEPHTSETVAVLELDRPTPRNADRWVDWCVEQVNAYVDVSTEHWVPFHPLLYLPSKEQVAAGAAWLRCDSSFPGDWTYTSARPVDFPHKNAAEDHAEELRACLDRDPVEAEQAVVDCASPHAYESTGKIAVITGVDSYPSAERRRKASGQCAKDLPPGRPSSSFEAFPVWDDEDQFGGGELYGVCFMHRKDGSPFV